MKRMTRFTLLLICISNLAHGQESQECLRNVVVDKFNSYIDEVAVQRNQAEKNFDSANNLFDKLFETRFISRAEADMDAVHVYMDGVTRDFGSMILSETKKQKLSGWGQNPDGSSSPNYIGPSELISRLEQTRTEVGRLYQKIESHESVKLKEWHESNIIVKGIKKTARLKSPYIIRMASLLAKLRLYNVTYKMLQHEFYYSVSLAVNGNVNQVKDWNFPPRIEKVICQ